MSTTAIPTGTADRRAARRASTRAEIVEAAWELARERGLAGISMRDLGDRVGMRAQSVYSYVASKDEIYDAMFREGYEQFLAWTAVPPPPDATPLDQVRFHADRFFRFCADDPVRYQLLFLRTIPGFEPSPASYAVAIEAMAHVEAQLDQLGTDDPDAADLSTALFTGLVSQQLANDPGGTRWYRLVDRAAHMLMLELAPHLLPPAPSPRKKART
jgi:AcrR family transcriptional regulator